MLKLTSDLKSIQQLFHIKEFSVQAERILRFATLVFYIENTMESPRASSCQVGSIWHAYRWEQGRLLRVLVSGRKESSVFEGAATLSKFFFLYLQNIYLKFHWCGAYTCNSKSDCYFQCIHSLNCLLFHFYFIKLVYWVVLSR